MVLFNQWVEENKPSKADYLASQLKPVVSPKWKHGNWFYFWQGNGMLESVKRPNEKSLLFDEMQSLSKYFSVHILELHEDTMKYMSATE